MPSSWLLQENTHDIWKYYKYYKGIQNSKMLKIFHLNKTCIWVNWEYIYMTTVNCNKNVWHLSEKTITNAVYMPGQ